MSWIAAALLSLAASSPGPQVEGPDRTAELEARVQQLETELSDMRRELSALVVELRAELEVVAELRRQAEVRAAQPVPAPSTPVAGDEVAALRAEAARMLADLPAQPAATLQTSDHSLEGHVCEDCGHVHSDHAVPDHDHADHDHADHVHADHADHVHEGHVHAPASASTAQDLPTLRRRALRALRGVLPPPSPAAAKTAVDAELCPDCGKVHGGGGDPAPADSTGRAPR